MQPSHFLSTVLLVTALGQLASAQVAAYHDQTLAQHQAQITSLRTQGYRMTAVTSYGTAATPLFGAVWVRRSGTSWVPFSSVDAATYQSLFNTYSGVGFTVRLLSVHGSGSSTRFTGVFEVDSTPYWAAHDLTTAQFDQQCSQALDQGYIPTAVAVYGTSTTPLYAGVWTRNDDHVDWTWTRSTTPGDYQLHFNAATAGWLRPAIATLSSFGQYLTIWHDNQLTGGWSSSHDMTSAGYQAAVNALPAGSYPIDLHAAGSGAGARFAAVFAPSQNTVSRQWTSTGTAVLGLSAFDTWVQNLMQSTNVRAASLSVVRNGRLMLTRGYTWAEPGYPVTQPGSLFRIASMAKPLTSIALHKAIAANPVAINPSRTVMSYLPAIVPLDARINNVTLLNLLTHAGGWNIDALGFDPMFRDPEVAAYHGNTVPVTRDEIWRYMTLTRTLNFTPGTQSRYSNYGYMQLGRVLEDINPGMTYTQVVQRDVFTPLGVTRARLGGSSLGAAAPGEVRYHPKVPYVAQSVVSSLRPWVPGQYGSWNQGNMDSHGGWVMASPDFAAVLASFDLGDDSPVIDSATTANMWSSTAGMPSNVLRGWYRTNASLLRVLRHHNGGLPGTSTCGVLRSDGTGFVLFLNRDNGLGDTEYLQLDQIANSIAQWPDHDLFPSVGIPGLRSHVTGTFTAYGSGCAGTSGTPGHAGVGTPETDDTMTLRTTNGPAGGVALMLLGTSRTSYNGTPLPFSLSSLGARGCSVLAAPAAVHTQVLSFLGVGNTSIAIPDAPELVGIHVFSQAAVLDAAANTLGLVVSNGIDTRVGGWH
ncbi:MAG: serine hydrolase [Planctomycetes bacterium]|nr:serine hydrolase [Planctomycetota bacterium]